MDAAESQYEENSKIALLLEDKAQKSATIAGVLLAAGLTFVKKETFGPVAARFSIPFVEIVVVLTVVLLLLTIALCVFVLWVRERPASPVVGLKDMAVQINSVPENELDESAYARFLNDCFDLWPGVLNQQERINSSKSRELLFAHIALSISFVLIGWLLILSMEAIKRG
ncbi:MAG TPA: hypothetical protein VGG72_04445 [Bryobacteraceae bacterium]